MSTGFQPNAFQNNAFQISGGITGALTVTEGNDTLSSSGAVALAGALALTEANDSVSSSASLLVGAALAVTESNDTLSAAGTNGSSVTGTAAFVEADDTLSASVGSPPYGRNHKGAGGRFWGWRRKKKLTEEEELEDLEAFLRAVKGPGITATVTQVKRVNYNGPLSVAFYDPIERRTNTVNDIMAKAKADAQRRERDDEEALLLLID